MRKIKMIVVASMMCVLFQGYPFGTAAFGLVTPTTYRPDSAAGDDNDTTFTFDFEIINTSDLRVWERTDSTGVQTLKTETTDYSVTATNLDFTSGGTVTMVTAPATGVTLVIGRVIPYDQQANFIDAGVISLSSVTDALDAVTLKVQQLEEMLNRAGLNPETDDTTLDMTLPNSVDRASQFYGFNGSGEPTVISSGITAGDATVTAYAETYLDDASEAAFKQTTNLEAGTDFHAYTANGNTILTDAGVLALAGDTSALVSIESLANAADKFLYLTGTDTFANADITAAGRALVDDATAAAQLTTLGGSARDGSVAYTGTGVGFTDDDSMATVTATAPASGESVKAYVDAQVSPAPEGDDPVTVDSDAQTMVKAHAYLAQTLGYVTAWSNTASTSAIKGYVGTTNNPAGAGTQVGENGSQTSIKSFVSFLVGNGNYFELTHAAAVVNITWTPIVSGGANPIDQD